MDVMTADEIIDSVRGLSFGAATTANQVDPAVWATESYKMAKRDVYNLDLLVVPTEHGEERLQATVDDHYHQIALRDARKRIRLAGHRLALLLKQTL